MTLTTKIQAGILLMLLIAMACIPVFVHAATQGDYTKDFNGNWVDVLPQTDITNQQIAPANGLVSLTCPSGTNQFGIATADGSNYRGRIDLVGACPTGNVTNGSACEPRETLRGNYPSGHYIGVESAVGTTVNIMCYQWQVN